MRSRLGLGGPGTGCDLDVAVARCEFGQPADAARDASDLTGGDRLGDQLGVAFQSRRRAEPRGAHAGDHARFASARSARPRFSPRLSAGPVMPLRLVVSAKGAAGSAPVLIDPANPSQGRV